MQKILIPIFVLMVAGCATNSGTLGTMERLTVVCNGYAALLNSLSAFRDAGRLSEGQIKTVNEWEPILTDTCLSPPENVTASLLNNVEAGMFKLIQIKNGVES